MLHLELVATVVSLLLLGNTESLSSPAGGFGTLTSDLDSPVVTETSVVTHLLHSLEIFSVPGVDNVGNALRPGAVLGAALSVQEPFGDVVFLGLGQDVRNFVSFGFSQITSAAVEVNLGDLADQVSESSTDTPDDSKSEHDFVLAVHIRVLHSQNVRELSTWIF